MAHTDIGPVTILCWSKTSILKVGSVLPVPKVGALNFTSQEVDDPTVIGPLPTQQTMSHKESVQTNEKI